ncbi:DUF3443 family protein [Caballeronia mineralivorans]|jgi:hypothetical protein|uniref:DUF3443 family protein n=1 Tax=Caballeronia mineralivorans TaxID=2010198 RepID=UPI0023F57709|nr:DUF3443 family protein [Caballeronia mineralivorans]
MLTLDAVSPVRQQSNPQRSTANVTMVEGTSMTAVIESDSGADYMPNAPLPTRSVEGITWYCPSSLTSQSTVFTGGGSGLNVTFQMANAQSVLA